MFQMLEKSRDGGDVSPVNQLMTRLKDMEVDSAVFRRKGVRADLLNLLSRARGDMDHAVGAFFDREKTFQAAKEVGKLSLK